MSQPGKPSKPEPVNVTMTARSVGLGTPFAPSSEHTPPMVAASPAVTDSYLAGAFKYQGDTPTDDAAASGENGAKGGFSELAAISTQKAPGTLQSRSHYQVTHHFGVHIAELLSGNLIVPRILVFLCECILRTGAHDVGVFRAKPNPQRLQEARARFNAGHFYDPGDPVTTATLLKQFCREVPISLVPPNLYDRCLVSILDHIQNTKLHFQQSKYRGYLCEGRSETVDEAFTTVLKGDKSKINEPSSLSSIISRYAFNVGCEIPALREIFFDLPRLHRNALEYLGVFFAKLSLDSQVNGCTVEEIAEVFSPFLVRPPFWPSMTVDNQQRLFLTEKFVVMFLYFLKKKHNILTKAEREELDKSDEQVMAGLVVEAVPSAKVLNLAAAPAPTSAPPQVVPTAGTAVSQLRGIEVNMDTLGADAVTVPMYPGESVTQESGPGDEDKTLIQGVLDNLSDMGGAAAQMFSPSQSKPDAKPKAPAAPPKSPKNESGGFLGTVEAMWKSGAETVSSMFEDGEKEVAQSSVDRLAAFDIRDESSRIKAEVTGQYVFQSWVSPFRADPTEFPANAPTCQSWLQEPTVQPHKPGQDSHVNTRGVDTAPSLPEHGLGDAPGRGLLPITDTGDDHGSSSRSRRPSSDRGSRAGSIDEPDPELEAAINYDAAISFPSTVNHMQDGKAPDDGQASADERRHPSSGKSTFRYDTDSELLNHAEVIPVQVMHCEQCNFRFSHLFSARERSYCRYCGRTLCSDCCNRQFFLPSALLSSGDLGLHTLCAPCKTHLSQHVHHPVLDYQRLSSTAMKNLGHVDKDRLDRARTDLKLLLDVVRPPGCPSSTFFLGLIPRRYIPFLADPPRISINDILELKSGKYISWLTYLEQLLRLHISQCRQCDQKVNE